ncbi:MAG: hypothetical protein WCJ03_09510 [Bacteroidales bacterium]
MTTIELKSSLMHQIAEINDIGFLKALKTIVDTKVESQILILTEEQKAEILKSQTEVAEGQFAYHNDVTKELEEWLKGK